MVVMTSHFTLKLVLVNTSEGSEDHHVLQFEGTPDSVTVLDVKKEVETKHKVPTFYQELYFESIVLRDENTLTKYSIREGDSVTVKM